MGVEKKMKKQIFFSMNSYNSPNIFFNRTQKNGRRCFGGNSTELMDPSLSEPRPHGLVL